MAENGVIETLAVASLVFKTRPCSGAQYAFHEVVIPPGIEPGLSGFQPNALPLS